MQCWFGCCCRRGFTFFFGRGARQARKAAFQKNEISPDLRICTVSHVCIRRNVHVRTELRRNQCWNRILLPSFSRGGTDCKCERKTGRRKDYLGYVCRQLDFCTQIDLHTYKNVLSVNRSDFAFAGKDSNA